MESGRRRTVAQNNPDLEVVNLEEIVEQTILELGQAYEWFSFINIVKKVDQTLFSVFSVVQLSDISIEVDKQLTEMLKSGALGYSELGYSLTEKEKLKRKQDDNEN